jgi:AmmeMemoRadiSam system protein B
VILGTGHQCLESKMVFTKKSFNTPLGIVETDTEFIDRMMVRAPNNLFQEEMLHRDEHSIEFQVVWLKHILGDSWTGKIVPILCGSFYQYVQNGISPREDNEFAQLLDCLREEIVAYDGKVTVIAGVDLSHVGKQFGDENGISSSNIDRVTQDDKAVLKGIESGDAETFYRTIETIKDRNNVCGLSPIYMSLDLIRPCNGVVLHYDQAINQDTESVVSFTSCAFYSCY